MFHSYYSGCRGDHYYRNNCLAVALIPAFLFYSLISFPGAKLTITFTLYEWLPSFQQCYTLLPKSFVGRQLIYI